MLRTQVIADLWLSGYPELSEIVARTSRGQILNRFIDLADRVWTNDVKKQFEFKLAREEPAGGVLAALRFPKVRGHSAAGDTIFRAPTKFELMVSDRLFEKDQKTIDGILIHEACHMGYPKHDAGFRKLVVQKGGFLTETASEEGNAYRVEVKEGSRYKLLKKFDTELEATLWAKEQLAKHKKRYVLQVKERGKFRDVQTFDSPDDAHKYAVDHDIAYNPKVKYRIGTDAPKYRISM